MRWPNALKGQVTQMTNFSEKSSVFNVPIGGDVKVLSFKQWQHLLPELFLDPNCWS